MRMIPAPTDLNMVSFKVVSGPLTIGTTQSTTQFVQNTIDPFGPWVFELKYPPLKGRAAREFKKWRTGFLGGGNCSRFRFHSEDEPTFRELDIDIGESNVDKMIPWTNGENWTNGRPWTAGKPWCAVTAAAAYDSSVITIDVSSWNGVIPAWFGIVGHFGVYQVIGSDVTGDIARLNVWPPVRKAITTSDYATLNPTVCITLVNSSSASGMSQRGGFTDAGLVVREVLDETVRSSVTEGF